MATTTYQGSGDGQVSVGRIISRAFSFVANSPAIALGSAILFGALPSVLSQFVTFSTMQTANAQSSRLIAGFGALSFFTTLVALVFSGLMQAAITRGLVIRHEGGRPTFGQCLAGGLKHAVPIVLLIVLWWIGIVLGSILFVVPGLILLTMWSVAVPALVEEGTGIIGAFRRSRELTSGSRWKIFGMLIMLLVLYYLALAVLGLVGLTATGAAGFADPARSGPPMLLVIGAGISGFVMNLLWSIIQPSLFVELRDAKEGGGVGELHQVFA